MRANSQGMECGACELLVPVVALPPGAGRNLARGRGVRLRSGDEDRGVALEPQTFFAGCGLDETVGLHIASQGIELCILCLLLSERLLQLPRLRIELIAASGVSGDREAAINN